VPSSLVVVNPHASRVRDASRRSAVVARIVAALTARDGEPPEVVEPGMADEVGGVVCGGVARGASVVVGVGGDGTLKDVAADLAGTGIPLGIVPAGTGNLVAGVLGVPGGLLAAADALRGARARPVDLGIVRVEPTDGPHRSMPFLVGCGAGFDARVMAETPPDLKRRMGRMAYFLTAVLHAARIGAVPYRLTIDGERLETEASIAMALNMGALIPGRVTPRLPIRPDDGLLDVIVVGARGPVQGVRGLLDQLLRSELGGGASATTLRLRGRSVRIESEPAEPLQVDGDHLGAGALEASVQAGALRVLVPPRALPGGRR
jgi:diacylglycerol kinase family enzyme